MRTGTDTKTGDACSANIISKERNAVGNMKITKRSGNIVFYDDEKVVRSIMRANEGTGEPLTARAAESLADAVMSSLIQKYSIITTQMIRDGVYAALRDRDLFLTAREYMEFKKDEKTQ